MTTTATGPIVWTNDTEDSERASDRISRYGAYLRQRRSWFDFGDMSAAEFAAVCWQIATSPIMAPGYISHHHDIDHIAASSNDDGQLLLRLAVPLPHRTLMNRTLLTRQRVQDWDRDGGSGRREPEHFNRPAVLALASIVIPIHDGQLAPAPSSDPGPELTRWAKAAVTVVAEYAVAYAPRLLDTLLNEDVW